MKTTQIQPPEGFYLIQTLEQFKLAKKPHIADKCWSEAENRWKTITQLPSYDVRFKEGWTYARKMPKKK